MIIGIIGGGQLGMMMAESAKKMGHEVIGLDPNPRCSLSYIADDIIVSQYNNEIAFEELLDRVDVITYEFENVDLSMIEKHIDCIPQGSKGLIKSRNRLEEKNFANSLDIPTVKYVEYNDRTDVFTPSIIKTLTGGYDGKGQTKILCKTDIDQFTSETNIEYIIEELIEFDYEISVIATRDYFGNIVTFPIPRNKHRNGILFKSEVFDDINQGIGKRAVDFTKRIVESLSYVGTLAVEYFVKGDEVIFNEFAPRPHNSGHYTIEGCNISQYDNHILAITNQKVQVPKLVSKAIMINVLGQNMEYLNRVNPGNTHIHMYKKEEVKENRKMGHITIVGNSINDVLKTTNYITEE